MVYKNITKHEIKRVQRKRFINIIILREYKKYTNPDTFSMRENSKKRS